MTWMVTRQIQWSGGHMVVEVSGGGWDLTNPDALSPSYKHLGEFKEFDDPRAACEAAIAVAHAWRKDQKGKKISVAHGHTGGMTMPFEPCTTTSLRKWAKDTYANMKKCGNCQALIREGRDVYRLEYDPDTDYCSEHCIEAADAQNQKDAEEERDQ